MRALVLLVTLSGLLQTPGGPRRERLVIHGDTVDREHVPSTFRRRPAIVKDASEVAPDELRLRHLLLVGLPTGNRIIAALPDIDGLSIDEAGFEWHGTRFSFETDLLQLRTANPWNHDLSMELVLGRVSAPLPPRRAAVQIRRSGRTVLVGFDVARDSYHAREFSLSTLPELTTKSLRVFAHGVRLTPDIEETLRAHANELGAAIDLHLYPDLETKGLVTDDTRSAHQDNGAVHAVLGVDPRPFRLIYELANGSSEDPLLIRRGVAAVHAYTDDELDRLDRVAARLLATSDAPSVEALLDDEAFLATSPLVTDAVSASFVRSRESEAGDTGESLSEAVAAWVRGLRGSAAHEPTTDVAASEFHKGMTFAHEGYQIHNGYLSAKARESMSKLGTLGVDSVAIVPYAFMREPTEVVPLDVPTRPGSETDDDVVAAIRSARSLGMSVMLKPQIWIRRSWPGDIDPQGDEAVDRFFREYRAWIRHYALIAEEQHAPLFAVGTELAKLTSSHRKQWERLISDVRLLYSGRIVYAANWGAEVENLVFWDLLDFIGVDFYYPLSFDEEPSEAALEEGFAAALEPIRALHERHQTPVLLTEIGYASTEAPWRKPHASDKEPEASAEDQALAYGVALEAVAAERDWIRGMYWWKWPSRLERGGPGHRGFTPNGKLAEEVMRSWYRGRLE